MRVAVRPERRRQAEQELCGMLDQALGTMEAALTHSGDAVLEEVLRAFVQWLQVTSSRGVSATVLQQHVLVQRAFQELQGNKRFEVAVDVLDELIYCTVFINPDGLAEPRAGMEPLIMARFYSRLHCLGGAMACAAGRVRHSPGRHCHIPCV
jgi:hypothetical protein